MCITKTIATPMAGKTLATKPKCLPIIGAATQNVETKFTRLTTLFTWNAGAIAWCQLKAGKWQAFTSFLCAKSIMAMLATRHAVTKMQRTIQKTGLAMLHLLNAEIRLSTTDYWFQASERKQTVLFSVPDLAGSVPEIPAQTPAILKRKVH